MITVGNSLRAVHGSSYVIEQLYAQAQAAGGGAVIESARTMGEVEFLRSPLQFTDWNALPVGGVKIKLVGDWEVQVKRVVGGQENGLFVALALYWNGVEVPGTYKTIPLPLFSQVMPQTSFDWKVDVWKGVSLDVKAALVWEP